MLIKLIGYNSRVEDLSDGRSVIYNIKETSLRCLLSKLFHIKRYKISWPYLSYIILHFLALFVKAFLINNKFF